MSSSPEAALPPLTAALLPEPLRKFCGTDAPPALMEMAAKGLVPIPPKDLVLVQCVLAAGESEAVKAEADRALRAYPDAILRGIVKGDALPQVLDVLAERVIERPALIEGLLLNRQTADQTIARLVPHFGEAQLDLVFKNEERLLRSAALVRALREHPQASRAALDRMFDFLVRAGVFLDDMPDFAEALLRLSSDERQAAVAQIEVPEDLLDPGISGKAAPAPLTGEESAEGQAPEGGEEEDPKKLPLLARITAMSTAQKVALALKGNKEVRSILLRDSNKVVAVAAIKNPQLTEQEVVVAAQSKSANEEVIRIISSNREWTRSYGVKLALVNNPKTPIAIAMRFLPLLNSNDVRAIAKSKNLPSAVANQARQFLQKASH